MSRETSDQMLRNSRIVKWMRAQAGAANRDYVKWEHEVWWGFWLNGDCGDGPLNPPDALFPTQAAAEGFAAATGKEWDMHVGPCVLAIEFRDNFEVPE